MASLVSVIIPCYNAEQWISEAIDSALSQTYSPVEVIVIDDGSTDNSLETIKSYGDRIQWETGSNRGQSAAKNRGFQLSQGEYIQWLDSDDYLLPKKIEQQVLYLTESNDDIVYGDWRHQHHQPDSSTYLGDIKISGEKVDILESLLSGWWAAPLAYLMRREVVEKINGWDTNLRVLDDPDFWIRAAIEGAKFGYEPGCYSVYRRYGNVTVSTKSRKSWCSDSLLVWEKAERLLLNNGALEEKYKKALARFYFHLARNYFDIDRACYYLCLQRAKDLDPQFKPSERLAYNILAKLFGFTISDYLASTKRKYFPSDLSNKLI